MLLYLIITSPIAFSGNALPALKGYQKSHWTDLLHQTFLAPVFLLFMLIVARILGAPGIKDAITKANGTGAVNVSGYFYYIFAIYFLKIALDKTKELSGDVADMAVKIAKGVGVAVAAAVTGGASLSAGAIICG